MRRRREQNRWDFLKKTGKSVEGSTMVEVIVAFTILVLIMGMFSQALSMAGNMMNRAYKTLEVNRQLAGDYYLEKAAGGSQGFSDKKKLSWKFVGKDNGYFNVLAEGRSYRNSEDGAALYDVQPTTKAADGQSEE